MADNQQKRSGAGRGNARGGKQQADARRAARRAARESVLALLFETEFHEDDTPETVYLRAADMRGLGEIPAEDSPVSDAPSAPVAPREETYIRATYLGIMQHLSVIDTLIGRHAKGWSTGRLSRVSRAVLRLGVYEIAFDEKIPAPIAINEAVELSKKFDDPKARAFINGVLNAVKNELTENGGRLPEGLVVEAAEPVAPVEVAEAPAEDDACDEAVEAVETAESGETAADIPGDNV